MPSLAEVLAGYVQASYGDFRKIHPFHPDEGRSDNWQLMALMAISLVTIPSS